MILKRSASSYVEIEEIIRGFKLWSWSIHLSIGCFLFGSIFTFSNHQGLFSKWSLVVWKRWLVSQSEQCSPSRPGESLQSREVASPRGESTHVPNASVHAHSCSHTCTGSTDVRTHGYALVREPWQTGSLMATVTHSRGRHIWLVPSPRLFTSVSTVSLRTLKGTEPQQRPCLICYPINDAIREKGTREIHTQRGEERRGPGTAILGNARLPGCTWSWKTGSPRISFFMSYLKSGRLKALFKNLGGPHLHLLDNPNIQYKHSTQSTTNSTYTLLEP